MKFDYQPKGVCPKLITFDLSDDGKVHDVSFFGGCNGNLKAISKLIEGMPADQVIATFKGNTCGMKSTSCADQLAQALEKAKEQMK